jgi:serine protease SohB
MLADLHQQFIELVKARRGDKLSDDGELFSGRFWTGATAREKGLIDGTAQLGDFLRDRFGKDVKIRRISAESGSLLRKLLSGGDALSAPSLVDAEDLLAAGERRSLWARFGL